MSPDYLEGLPEANCEHISNLVQLDENCMISSLALNATTIVFFLFHTNHASRYSNLHEARAPTGVTMESANKVSWEDRGLGARESSILSILAKNEGKELSIAEMIAEYMRIVPLSDCFKTPCHVRH